LRRYRRTCHDGNRRRAAANIAAERCGQRAVNKIWLDTSTSNVVVSLKHGVQGVTSTATPALYSAFLPSPNRRLVRCEAVSGPCTCTSDIMGFLWVLNICVAGYPLPDTRSRPNFRAGKSQGTGPAENVSDTHVRISSQMTCTIHC
jgi:hypothetical protein